MTLNFQKWYQTDLQKPIKVMPLEGLMFTDDNEANLIGVEVMDGGTAATLTGTVTGYVIRGDEYTVTIAGTLSGNKASIILSSQCYDVVGSVSIVIKVGAVTVCACHGYVNRSTTDAIVDPGHVIPSLDELLAQIGLCEQATTDANNAAENANNKATAANNAATAANNAASAIQNITASATLGSVSVTVSTVDGHKHLAFTLPCPNFVGNINITTLPYEDDATASITGTAESPILNLGIPRGAPGDISNAYGTNLEISSTDPTTIKAYIDNADTALAANEGFSVVVTFSATGTQTITDSKFTADFDLIGYQFIDALDEETPAVLADIDVTTGSGTCTVEIVNVYESGSVRLKFGYAPEVS